MVVRLGVSDLKEIMERRLATLATMQVRSEAEAEVVSWEVIKVLIDPVFGPLGRKEREEIFFQKWFESAREGEKTLVSNNV